MVTKSRCFLCTLWSDFLGKCLRILYLLPLFLTLFREDDDEEEQEEEDEKILEGNKKRKKILIEDQNFFTNNNNNSNSTMKAVPILKTAKELFLS